MVSIFIIEGPDGAGKTTVKETLIKELNLTQAARHCTSEGGPVDSLSQWVEQDIEKPYDPSIIYDRHALVSEPIYGPLTRGTLSKNFENSAWYLGAWHTFIQRHPVFIFCLPPLGVVRYNLDHSNNAQMSRVKENITSIYWAYHFLCIRLIHESYMALSTGHARWFDVYRYDYAKDRLTDIIDYQAMRRFQG